MYCTLLQVGRDVSQCLQQAMSRKGLNMRVAALVSSLFHLFLHNIILVLNAYSRGNKILLCWM